VSRRGGFASAAALIAVLTALSRLVGFGRTLVLGGVAKPGLSQAYLTANTIPNIIFEIVAGGALAGLVVPMVAGAIARDDRRGVGATASALLTWVLVILVPLALLVAVFAHPIVSVLIPPTVVNLSDATDVGAGMLRIFAPQIPLYGIGIVLAGLLQAHRRFAWPVLAPLLSSVVVIATYALYGVLEPNTDIPFVSQGGQLILSVGTTLGVVVLSLCLVIPVRRLGLSYRPSMRFPADARRTVGPLAVVGVITVAAQQLTLAVAVRLANEGDTVSLFTFTLAQTIYLVPWAVLAVPVAISVYPALATAAATGDEAGYQRTLAAATRSVLLLSTFGAAALIAAATPIGRLFAAASRSADPNPGTLAAAVIAFAPGLIGYGLFALHSRALYARGLTRFAAVATVIGWGTVIATSYALAAWRPRSERVPALSAANSIGMAVLAGVLLVMIARRVGVRALAGATRATVASIVAGGAAAAAGIAVRVPLSDAPGVPGDIGQGMLSGVVAVVVFAAVAALIDRHDVRPVALRLARMAGVARGPRDGGDNEDPREREV
jgi:putative peptidoglycan lipid II flippase